MSYNRAKPLGSGMLKKDFRDKNTGGWRLQLARIDDILDERYTQACARSLVRIKQAQKKHEENERRRLQRDAARAA